MSLLDSTSLMVLPSSDINVDFLVGRLAGCCSCSYLTAHMAAPLEFACSMGNVGQFMLQGHPGVCCRHGHRLHVLCILARSYRFGPSSWTEADVN